MVWNRSPRFDPTAKYTRYFLRWLELEMFANVAPPRGMKGTDLLLLRVMPLERFHPALSRVLLVPFNVNMRSDSTRFSKK